MTRPSAKQIAREFQGGASMGDLQIKYTLFSWDIEAAIRKYVIPGGRNGR